MVKSKGKKYVHKYKYMLTVYIRTYITNSPCREVVYTTICKAEGRKWSYLCLHFNSCKSTNLNTMLISQGCVLT